MPFPQLKSSDERVELLTDEHQATLRMDGVPVAVFDVKHEEVLSPKRAETFEHLDPARWMVTFGRSSPRARSILRSFGLSYASVAGELYVHRPPVHVEIPPTRRGAAEMPRERPSPFAIRASRVPRWLLLHSRESHTVSGLSASIDLSPTIVSRTVQALVEEAFVSTARDPEDARVKRVIVSNPSAMIDAFDRSTFGRRTSRSTWDVGSQGPEKTLDRLRRAAHRTALPYAVGGLAGAAFGRRITDPATVDVWIRRDDLEVWTEALTAVPSSPRRGAITFRAMPDPFVLSLAGTIEGLRVADPVQLFLDCRQAGERAIDVAEAVREEMGW
jgi:hypothetical protein